MANLFRENPAALPLQMVQALDEAGFEDIALFSDVVQLKNMKQRLNGNRQRQRLRRKGVSAERAQQ